MDANSALFGYFIGAILAAVITWFACWLTNHTANDNRKGGSPGAM